MTVVSNRHYSLPIYFANDYSQYKEFGQFTEEWRPTVVLADQIAPWIIDATGKIAGNGTYEVTFIQTSGDNNLQIQSMKVLKRDELLDNLEQAQTVTREKKVTFRFQINSFEAGTPFYLEPQMAGQGGNDTKGLVFIRKITE